MHKFLDGVRIGLKGEGYRYATSCPAFISKRDPHTTSTQSTGAVPFAALDTNVDLQMKVALSWVAEGAEATRQGIRAYMESRNPQEK